MIADFCKSLVLAAFTLVSGPISNAVVEGSLALFGTAEAPPVVYVVMTENNVTPAKIEQAAPSSAERVSVLPRATLRAHRAHRAQHAAQQRSGGR